MDLLQFTYSGDRALLADAAMHMAVLEGDRNARLQLDKDNPNYQVVTEQYMRGGNAVPDLPSVVRVYRLFRHTPMMLRAIEAWRDTDEPVSKLEAMLSYLSKLTPGELSGPQTVEIRSQLANIDDELTERLNTFSLAMNSAGGWAESTLLITNVTAGFGLMFVAGYVTRKLTRSVRRSQLRDRALRRANDELEIRVRQRTAELEKQIQERIKADGELRWKTAFLEAQGNATVDGILVVNSAGDQIFRNQQFLRLWNIPPDIDIPKDSANEGSDAPLLKHVVGLTKYPDRFLEEVLYLYAHPNEISRDEIELKNGTVLDRYSAPVLGTIGEYYGRIWTFRDITEQRRHENALRESEERFRLVVEASPIGIYIQTDGVFRYLNAAALKMFGAKNVYQVIGQSLEDRIHPDSCAAVAERAKLVMQEGKAVPPLEEKHLRLDGSAFDTEASAEPFVFDGQDGAIVFLRDITERKREDEKRRLLEQQLRQAQKLESLGRLAGGIAHDFNNLLMGIRTYTEMLQDRFPIGDSLRRNTEQVLKAAERGARLTAQMLAFSRKQIVSPTVFDLNAMIAETAKMLKRLIGEDISFKVEPDDSLWPIEADPDQIAQVLMNLCVNSRDAMPRGGTLTIATRNRVVLQGGLAGHPSVLPGEYVSLSVTDSGTGISKELQDEIFEPFFTTKEVGKGTGLGLSIVYGVVQQSAGYVWVDSESGQGTCFTIYLPKTERSVVPKIAAKAERSARGTETLLVVEDDNLIREGICEFLRSLGYTVFAADSGEAALVVAGEQEQIDLLLTDVVMPKMSGRELSRILAGVRPSMKTIHMSGYTDDAVLRDGIHDMNTAFLQKPFSLGTLATKVRATLGSV